MTIEEAGTLAESTMATVGAHGVTHTALSALSRERQGEELAGSKRKLESWFGREVSVFAYPYGGRSYYTRESMRLCGEAGFRKAAAANFPGQAHRWTHPFEIPRQMVLDWSADEFAGRLLPLFTA
jgi:peptidoglycan/xylan/chitin deacetylase (PgdA/CDA1 family)